MKLTGYALLGLGILLFVLGVFLQVGVVISGIPMLAMISWIPMGVGGILIIVGIVLIVIRRG